MYLAYVPLDFEGGVKALLTASLALLMAAGLTEADKDPAGEGKSSSGVLK